MIKVKAVIFDYGNVLCEPQRGSDISSMAEVLKLENAVMEPLYWRHRDDYDRGRIDAVNYWATVGHNAGKSLTDEQIRAAILLDNKSWSRPNNSVVNWVKLLRKHGIRTAILSNMPMELRKYIDSVEWIPEFEHRLYSCDAGCIKPDPEIYHRCLELLGLTASETLFLDDRQPNIDTARSIGIHGLVFSTFEDLRKQIINGFHLPVPETIELEQSVER